MHGSKTTAFVYPNAAAYEKPPTTPSSITEGTPRRKSNASPRPRPYRCYRVELGLVKPVRL